MVQGLATEKVRDIGIVSIKYISSVFLVHCFVRSVNGLAV